MFYFLRFSILRFEAPVDTDVAVEAITAAIAKGIYKKKSKKIIQQ